MRKDTYISCMAIVCQMNAQVVDGMLSDPKASALWQASVKLLKNMITETGRPNDNSDLNKISNLVKLMLKPGKSIPVELHEFCSSSAQTLIQHFRLNID